MIKCIESITSGRNLNYKYLVWIWRHATKLGIKGITFFKSDGSIKVIAEGEEKNINLFIRKLKRGRCLLKMFSPIEYFSVIHCEPRNEFRDFSINEGIE